MNQPIENQHNLTNGVTREKNSPGYFSESNFDPFSEGDSFLFKDSKKNMWSVPWADLMMTMFVFFAVLYIYQAGNRDLRLGEGPGNSNISDTGSHDIVDLTLEQKPSEIFNQTNQAILDEFITSEAFVEMVSDKSIRIVIAGDLLFDIGSAELKSRAKLRLGQIARILKKNDYAINVAGHTDSTPNHSQKYPTNWELSVGRACNVARYLIEGEGIAENRFFISGYSWHLPVLREDNRYNRAINRRVEIILVKEKPYLVSATNSNN